MSFHRGAGYTTASRFPEGGKMVPPGPSKERVSSSGPNAMLSSPVLVEPLNLNRISSLDRKA